MNKLKSKFLAMCAAVGATGVALAEGSEAQIDVSAATGALTSMKTAFETYMNAATPVLIGMIAIGLGIYLAIIGWKLWKKVTNKAT